MKRIVRFKNCTRATLLYVLCFLAGGFIFSAQAQQAGGVIITPTFSTLRVAEGYTPSEFEVSVVAGRDIQAVVTVKLPAGVVYQAGSVLLDATTPGYTITEQNIADLNNPQFRIVKTNGSNIVTGDRFKFSIKRQGDCSVYVATDQGVGLRDIATVDFGGTFITDNPQATYGVDAPSFTVRGLDTQNNIPYNVEQTRTFEVVTGGDGNASAVHLYVDYPAKFEQISLSLGGTVLTPEAAQAGDPAGRKRYIISGNLLGSDQLFTNNEVLTFTEKYRITDECIAQYETAYTAGWVGTLDTTGSTLCQRHTANGTVNADVSASELQIDRATSAITASGVTMCAADGQIYKTYTVAIKNTGTSRSLHNIDLGTLFSGNQNFEYKNFRLLKADGTTTSLTTSLVSLNHFMGETGTASATLVFNKDSKIQDTGFEDLDGDGNYDDLRAGASVKLQFDVLIKKYTPNCTDATNQAGDIIITNQFLYVNYTDACGNIITTGSQRKSINGSINGGISRVIRGTRGYYLPTSIYPNQSFSTTAYFSQGSQWSDTEGVEVNRRIEFVITLPAGFTASNVKLQNGVYPNATTEDTSASVTVNGQVVTIVASDNGLEKFVQMDVIKTCVAGDTSSGSVTFNYEINYYPDYVGNPTCKQLVYCSRNATRNMGACPIGNCDGISTTSVTVRRADNSLGWTDETMTTRQTAANISEYQLARALYLDDIEVHSAGQQGIAASDNLYQYMSLSRIGNGNARSNHLEARKIVVTLDGGTSVTINASATNPVMTVQGDSQVFRWDLSSALPAGGLLSNTPFTTVATYQHVSETANRIDKQMGQSLYYYSVDAAGNEVRCGSAVVPGMYLLHTALNTGENQGWYMTSCASTRVGGFGAYFANRFEASGILFTDEYRPGFKIEEIELVLSDGIRFHRGEYRSYRKAGDGIT